MKRLSDENVCKEAGMRVPNEDENILRTPTISLGIKELRAVACKAEDEILKLMRARIAIEYKKAITESDRQPFPSEKLNKEHKIIWRGHANAYSEVLSDIDSF